MILCLHKAAGFQEKRGFEVGIIFLEFLRETEREGIQSEGTDTTSGGLLEHFRNQLIIFAGHAGTGSLKVAVKDSPEGASAASYAALCERAR